MKTLLNSRFGWLLAVLCLLTSVLCLPVSAHAQDLPVNAPTDAVLGTNTGPAAAGNGAITADGIVQWLTPLLVPLILAGAKRILPDLPGWSLPLLAPCLGVILDVINTIATGHALNLWQAAGLGLLGVAVRELKESVKAAPNGGWPVKPPID